MEPNKTKEKIGVLFTPKVATESPSNNAAHYISFFIILFLYLPEMVRKRDLEAQVGFVEEAEDN